ncbi:unnamed protein product, partial [Durusdinium trenchii]
KWINRALAVEQRFQTQFPQEERPNHQQPRSGKEADEDKCQELCDLALLQESLLSTAT